MVRAIINGTVYTPTRIVPDGVVVVDGDRVAAVGTSPRVTVPDNAERLDARGGIICPGFVDIHLHGGDGADCTDCTVEAVRAVARRHLRAGTTSFLATTGSAPLVQIWPAFDCIREAMYHPEPSESRILGIHMEGPFLSPSQSGAHSPELLRMPDPAEQEVLYSYAGDLARVTIAPEREGALGIIAELAGRGVLVSGGHSDALYEQVCLAIQAGMRHITHLWSCMSTVRRIGPKRHSGMLEAALVEEGLTVEIIADGYHLPTSLMKLAYRMKGADKLCVVSDAMRASGMGPGQYEVCGIMAVVEEGGRVAMTPDRTAFAGSISTVKECFQHLVQVVGVSLSDALQMASLTPARILGAEDQVGQLAPGCLADLLVLDRATLEPRLVMLGGSLLATQGR